MKTLVVIELRKIYQISNAIVECNTNACIDLQEFGRSFETRFVQSNTT
jgi:hypothetical protein